MTNPVVIDLSHHNEPYDFDVIRANGTVGIIHKATEGSTFIDDTYWQRRGDAVAAGLEWASYHFLRHGDVEEQMVHYLSVVNPQKGDRVCIDYEELDCTLDDLCQAVEFLLNYDVKLEVAVYSGHLIKEHLGDGYDEVLAKTSLWLAQYTDDVLDVTWPLGTWPDVSLWQYTDRAVCAGVASTCDGNAFNGSEENLHKWFNADYKTKQEPTPEPQPVLIDITVPEGIAVHITINGQPAKG